MGSVRQRRRALDASLGAPGEANAVAAKRLLVGLVAALVVLPAVAGVFDGERRGIVLGGGLGVSPVARWSAWGRSEDMVSLGMHMFGGYAWDERNMAGYELNIAIYNSDSFNSDSLLGSGDLLTSQGFQGASWYHFLGPPGQAFFTAVGLGFCVFDRGEGYHSSPGVAWLLGAGYTFTRRLQAGIYYSAGRTSDAGHDFAHRHLSLLVSGFVF